MEAESSAGLFQLGGALANDRMLRKGPWGGTSLLYNPLLAALKAEIVLRPHGHPRFRVSLTATRMPG